MPEQSGVTRHADGSVERWDPARGRWVQVSGPAMQVATQLPPVETPKVKPKQQSIAPYAPGVKPSAAVLARPDRQVANTDLLSFRREATTARVIRNLAAAVSSAARIAITERYRVKAYDMADGAFNVDATRLAYAMLARFDLVPDYTTGFSQINSLLSTSEALAGELMMEGAACMELVLDKARLPAKIVPLATSQIFFFEDDKGLRPVQRIAGVDVDLDVPTFFWVSLDQDLLRAYPTSPLEPAVQPVLADQEFTNDVRRVIKRSAFPRLSVTINREELDKSIPPETKADPDKLQTFINTAQSAIANVINGLAPEDALVVYNWCEVKYVEGGTGDVPDVFKTVQDIMNAKVATGAKALPSVLGHGSGSQNIASSETLLGMKNADGMIRMKLNELYSKAMTLGVRLFGHDVMVAFEYEAIDLRPTNELEAFFAMKQARILEMLSLGLITDEEACIDLTYRLPPAGMAPLSGTGFFNAPAAGGENPYSGTSNGGAGGGAMNQSLKPGTPTKPKGKAA
jgi:hypothetical protein